MEDLWAFNEEVVARAIAACPLPVISAVGHETDYTIADLVADLRAPTPSAAAELVSPSREELRSQLVSQLQRLGAALGAMLEDAASRQQALAHRLARCSPAFLVESASQRLDELAERLASGMRRLLKDQRDAFAAAAAQLHALSPLAILGRGYAAAFLQPGGQLLKSASQVQAGVEVKVLLGRGELMAKVTKSTPGSGHGG